MDKPSPILIDFGLRVRALRITKGISQEKLAELSDLDRTYVSSLERGNRNVGLKNIGAIAKALGISLSELFEGIAI